MSDANPAVLTATEKTRQSLGKTAPWALFLAVVGFIACGLLAVAGVLMAVIGGLFNNVSGMGQFGGLLWPVIGILYVGIAVVTFFPSLLMLRISRNSKAFGRDGAWGELENVAVNLHSLAKYWGVYTIVLLSVYAVAIVGGLVFIMAMPHSF